MKKLALVSAFCLLAALASCGGSDPERESSESATANTVTSESRAPTKEPKVTIPEGPPPTRLVVRDLREGDGTAAEVGDELTVEYVGYDYKSGYQFDTHAHRWGRGEPAVFELGAGDVIPGWDKGVEGMKVGGLRELIIPPDLAYGNVNPPPEVGPNETVIFVVELLGVK
jgi:peptidylprolyl isomerase